MKMAFACFPLQVLALLRRASVIHLPKVLLLVLFLAATNCQSQYEARQHLRGSEEQSPMIVMTTVTLRATVSSTVYVILLLAFNYSKDLSPTLIFFTFCYSSMVLHFANLQRVRGEVEHGCEGALKNSQQASTIFNSTRLTSTIFSGSPQTSSLHQALLILCRLNNPQQPSKASGKQQAAACAKWQKTCTPSLWLRFEPNFNG